MQRETGSPIGEQSRYSVIGTRPLKKKEEKADELARKGSKARVVGPKPTIGIHADFVKVLLKQGAAEEHQIVWEEIRTCIQAKEFLVGCKSSTTRYLLGLNRMMIVDLTNHNSHQDES